MGISGRGIRISGSWGKIQGMYVYMCICMYICILYICMYICIFHLSDAASSTSFATFISIEVCLFNMRRRGNTHSHTAYTYYIQCSQKVFAGQ